MNREILRLCKCVHKTDPYFSRLSFHWSRPYHKALLKEWTFNRSEVKLVNQKRYEWVVQ